MMSSPPLRPSVPARAASAACRTAAGAWWRALALALALAIPGLAHPDTLGDARQLSHVGEPLRLSIPVVPDGGPPLAERCLTLFGPRSSDGLPHILTARVAVERQGSTTNVVVTTTTPMRDPVVRLLLRTGCDGSSRAYTLFLEPAGSTRMLRAVAQSGPRLPPAPAPGAPEPAAGAQAEAAPAIVSPSVTTIPVAPGTPANRAEPSAGSNARSSARATEPVGPGSMARSGASVALAPKAAVPNAASPSAKPNVATGPHGTPAGSTPPGARSTGTAPNAGASPNAPAGAAAPPASVVTAVPGGVPLDLQSRPWAAAQEPAPAGGASSGAPASEPAAAQPKVSALEQENETLKQQVARMSGEIQRLQVEKPPAPSAHANGAAAITGARWDVALPVAIALAGLLAVIIGGFLWHRRHAAPTPEWPLTGPPSHRMASRTSLAEEPVPFRPTGVRTEVEATAIALEGAARGADATVAREAAVLSPAPLRLQPSPEDLARELEQELRVAERSHSALERAHPELVESLTRSWGTAAARNHLAALLAPGSHELARMSGEVVAELRLLLRVAEDLPLRNGFDPSPVGFTPPAPAW